MSKETIIIAFTCKLLACGFSFLVHQIPVCFHIFLFFFKFHKKLQIDALLNFHPSHESSRTTQNGHAQTKLRGKPSNVERRRVQSCSI
jgi:hypothetical protein